MKALTISVGTLLALLVALGGWNYFGVYGPVSQALAKDPRNAEQSVAVYRQYGVSPSTIVFDVRDVGEKMAMTDVLRAFFQSASVLAEKEFEAVVLARRGEARFMLQGHHFQKIGQSFESGNPVYMVRTLPERIQELDGTPAFQTWSGGMLGVLSNQLEDVSALRDRWLFQQ